MSDGMTGPETPKVPEIGFDLPGGYVTKIQVGEGISRNFF